MSLYPAFRCMRAFTILAIVGLLVIYVRLGWSLGVVEWSGAHFIRDSAAFELRKLGFFRESAVLRWFSLRGKILSWVSARGDVFHSTEQALRIAVLSAELKSVGEQIVFAYSIGTMAEWDQYCNINEVYLSALENACCAVEAALTL